MKALFFKENFVILLIFSFFLFFVILNISLIYKVKREKKTALPVKKSGQGQEPKDLKKYIDAKFLGKKIRQVAKKQATVSASVKPECLKVPYYDPNVGVNKVTEKDSNLVEYYYFAQVLGYQEKTIDDCGFSVIELATVTKNETGEKKGQKFYLTLPKDFKDKEDKFLPTVFKEIQNQGRVALYVTYEINKETEFLRIVSWNIETFFIH